MSQSRREFLKASAALTLTAGATPAASTPPGQKLVGEGSLLAHWHETWPRLVVDAGELKSLRGRIPVPSTLSQPNLKAEGSRALTPELAKLERAAFFWRLTGEDRFRDVVRRSLPLLPKIAAQPVTLHRGPNANDLDAGHTLRALAFTYDWLRASDWPYADVSALRQALTIQAKAVYEELRDHYATFAYDQNHTAIPASGLAMAGWALHGDEPEAPAWAGWARNYMDRNAEVLGGDGFYYEGGSYYDYGFPWIVLHAIVLKRMNGEDWTQRAVFRDLEKFVAHVTLPGCSFIFDFGDWGPRKGQAGYDSPWHSVKTSMTTWPLVALASNGAPGPARQAVIDWLPPTADSFYALWRSSPVTRDLDPATVPTHHHFTSHDALFWRSSWNDPDATAVMFKCGPPLGHHVAPLVARYPEWRMNAGHVHPDAGQFLIWTKGRFIAGDTGYTARKFSSDHNTLLVDGQGQMRDGRYHVFQDVDYGRLNQLRLANVWHTPEVMAATAVLEAGYDPSLGVRQLRRHLLLVAGKWLLVRDELTATTPRRLSFLWHTDAEPAPSGPSRWLFKNGTASAVMASLTPPDTTQSQPAMVQAYTGTPDHGEPLQRGWCLELRSASAPKLSLWHAFILNPRDGAAVTIQRAAAHDVRLTDGDETGVLSIDPRGPSDNVHWSYRMGDAGPVVEGP